MSGTTDTVKYLGLRLNWKGRLRANAGKILEDMLVNISKAPLKPHQKPVILKDFTNPHLQYELVLGSAHGNTLKALDIARGEGMVAVAQGHPVGFLLCES
ncbi:hypothetical protein T265_12135 [Opisthorchis viverrini]|uniref:Reverse transcriptase domain-containing protein n=1 Tax=Opisthorchis viverrini TaxID=6198 RepID=A0A074Z009_OPIVI|nr:hypothetical protein T265_12135 [Opisthorchis viverrini]XP_009177453.1 hypothetical protein T265_12150 [Opisthorchis viverrini]KER18802.1 hypothetical protein T265_12150 [Opisthorchis viverrini]KER18834.1 hypothetical protein T265_12135 [Opisthorchis viverrini]